MRKPGFCGKSELYDTFKMKFTRCPCRMLSRKWWNVDAGESSMSY
jgi:hypothetical protein